MTDHNPYVGIQRTVFEQGWTRGQRLLAEHIAHMHFRSHAEYCANLPEDWLAHLNDEAACMDPPADVLVPLIRAVASKVAKDA